MSNRLSIASVALNLAAGMLVLSFPAFTTRATPALSAALPRPLTNQSHMAARRMAHYGSKAIIQPRIYYDDGREIFQINADGTGLVALAVLPSGSDMRPRVVNGRLVYYDGTYWLAQPNGQRSGLTPPSLQPGEQVFDVVPSPDGRYVAWQLFAPQALNGFTSNMGVSRIVVSDLQTGTQTTVLRDIAGSTSGDVAAIYGWQGAQAKGQLPTLLLQTRILNPNDGLLNRGLQGFSLTIDDLIDDYLPATDTNLPNTEALSLSSTGQTLTYAPSSNLLPSGEGPLPTSLAILDLRSGHSTVLDQSVFYQAAPTPRHPQQTYEYFSSAGGAPISPDGRHVIYTLVTVTYPTGATSPVLHEDAEIVSVLSLHKNQLASGTRAVGWLDAQTAIVRASDGLYAVDITTKQRRLLVSGTGLHLAGVGG